MVSHQSYTHNQMFSLIGSLVVILVVYLLIQRRRRKTRVAELEEIVRRRRREREESIQWAAIQAQNITEEQRDSIQRMGYEGLKDALRRGEVTASSVLSAYIGLAIRAHEKTNCITLFIKESVEWAAEWDRKVSSDPSLDKPAFFGIPFSIKESHPVKGYDSTRGYVADAFNPKSEDTIIVQQIKSMGGIPFVHTNVPLSLLSYSCGNSLYGWTSSPLRKDRTSGGSSGGEAAIVGAGGSIIGIGSDVGGSIRVPAHFSGIAGFKPSHLRLSHVGCAGSVPGRPLVNSNAGPMAVSIHTCIDFLRQFWSTEYQSDNDPYVPPVKWRADQFESGKKYRIGFYVNDGWFKATPGCERVVREAKALLEAKGHTLVPFSPPNVPEAYRLFTSAVCVDGGAYILDRIENDLPPPEYLSFLRLLRLPLLLQRLLSPFARLAGYPRIALSLTAMALNTSELRRNYAAIEAYRHEFVAAMKRDGVDALLCPVQVMPAPAHEAPLQLSSAVSYTGIFNMLDFGAGVVKGGEWTEKDEADLEDYPTDDMWYKKVKQFSKNSVGFPIGVQVASPPYHEEAALRILADIEDGRGEQK